MQLSNSEIVDFELCFQDNKAFKVILRVGIRLQAALLHRGRWHQAGKR